MKKKIFLTAILIVVTIVSGFFYSYVKRSQAIYNTDYTRSQMVPEIRISEENRVHIGFTCMYDNLKQVEIILSTTSSSPKDYTLDYELCDSDGNKYEGGSIRFDKFKNGKFTTLKFDKIKNSRNKEFTLVLTTDAGDVDAAYVAVTPDMENVALKYTYIVWDLQTMIIYVLFIAYLAGFIAILGKLFRK